MKMVYMFGILLLSRRILWNTYTTAHSLSFVVTIYSQVHIYICTYTNTACLQRDINEMLLACISFHLKGWFYRLGKNFSICFLLSLLFVSFKWCLLLHILSKKAINWSINLLCIIRPVWATDMDDILSHVVYCAVIFVRNHSNDFIFN